MRTDINHAFARPSYRFPARSSRTIREDAGCPGPVSLAPGAAAQAMVDARQAGDHREAIGNGFRPGDVLMNLLCHKASIAGSGGCARPTGRRSTGPPISPNGPGAPSSTLSCGSVARAPATRRMPLSQRQSRTGSPGLMRSRA